MNIPRNEYINTCTSITTKKPGTDGRQAHPHKNKTNYCGTE